MMMRRKDLEPSQVPRRRFCLAVLGALRMAAKPCACSAAISLQAPLGLSTDLHRPMTREVRRRVVEGTDRRDESRLRVAMSWTSLIDVDPFRPKARGSWGSCLDPQLPLKDLLLCHVGDRSFKGSWGSRQQQNMTSQFSASVLNSHPHYMISPGGLGLSMSTPRTMLESAKSMAQAGRDALTPRKHGVKNNGVGKKKASREDPFLARLGPPRGLPPPKKRSVITAAAAAPSPEEAAPAGPSALTWIIENVPLIGPTLSMIMEFDWAADALPLLMIVVLVAAGVHFTELLAGEAMTEIFIFAAREPVSYLLLNFGIVAAIGVSFLFLKDMRDLVEAVRNEQLQAQRRGESMSSFSAAAAMWRRRFGPKSADGDPDADAEGATREPSREYQPLRSESGTDVEAGPSLVPALHEEREKGVGELKAELRNVRDHIEELEIRCRVHRSSESEAAVLLREELHRLEERALELSELLESGVSPQGLKLLG